MLKVFESLAVNIKNTQSLKNKIKTKGYTFRNVAASEYLLETTEGKMGLKSCSVTQNKFNTRQLLSSAKQ